MKKLTLLTLLVVLVVFCCSCFVGCNEDATDQIDDNYRVFYQIFVGSFSDSNGDGIGDIRGIINRMDYLNDGNTKSGNSLGIQGIWLSPIFTSPSYHKYDASNYYEVDPQFGTLEDLQELLEICHQRNVKVILDLAINHTSNRNEMFTKFKAARLNGDIEDPYYNFYTCVNYSDQISGTTYYPLGNNWYYEGNFSSDMPELDFDNQAVREETVNIAKYWLDIGVDGFRFDAVKYIYFNSLSSSVEFWKWYIAQLKEIKSDIYTVGECWSGDSEVAEYVAALNCFNFTTSGAGGAIATTARYKDISQWVRYLPSYQQSLLKKNSEAMGCLFIANHDMDRAAGFVTVGSGDAYMAANVYLLCWGSPFIYYGEEIGLKGSRGGENTDANRRLAMLWGDGDTIKDPEGATFDISKQINGTVADQLADKDSLLNYYAKLIALRNKYPQIARGTYTSYTTDEDAVGGFIINYEDTTTVLIHNVSLESVQIPMPEGCTKLCDWIGLNGASLKDGVLTIGPQTSVILK